MPLPLSVTDDNVPADVARVTLFPPVVRLLPFTSFSWTVIVVVDVPFAVIDDVAAVIVEVSAEGELEAGAAIL